MEDTEWFSSISLCEISPNRISFALNMMAKSAALFATIAQKWCGLTDMETQELV
jgi:hypothetical protein